MRSYPQGSEDKGTGCLYCVYKEGLGGGGVGVGGVGAVGIGLPSFYPNPP